MKRHAGSLAESALQKFKQKMKWAFLSQKNNLNLCPGTEVPIILEK
jgi:hypothetical protein